MATVPSEDSLTSFGRLLWALDIEYVDFIRKVCRNVRHLSMINCVEGFSLEEGGLVQRFCDFKQGLEQGGGIAVVHPEPIGTFAVEILGDDAA